MIRARLMAWALAWPLAIACGDDGQRLAPVDAVEDTAEETAQDTSGHTAPDSVVFFDADATAPGPRLSWVEPATLSARGGAEVTVHGEGLAEATGVTIGGAPAALLSATDGAVRVRAPRTLAGAADVRVTLPDGTLTLPAAITVEALRLTWASAAPETMVAPTGGAVRGAVAFDVDLDGDLDLVVATDEGLRVLLNDASGAAVAGDRAPHLTLLALADAEGVETALAPGGVGAVRGIAAGDVDGDGASELIACTDAGRELLMRPSGAGLEAAAPMPWRAGRCVGVTVADLDGDGVEEIALLVDRGAGPIGLLVVRRDAGGALVYDEEAAPTGEEAAIGVVSGDAEAPPSLVRAPLDEGDGGGAAARLRYTLTAAAPTVVAELPVTSGELPAAFFVRARGEAPGAVVRLGFVDAAGVRFEGPGIALGADWQEHGAASPATWPPAEGGEATPTPPLVALVIAVTASDEVVEAPLVGEVWLDDVVAFETGRMPRLLAGFDARAPRWAWAGASAIVAADMDGDDAGDLIVLGPARPAVLLTQASAGGAARWREDALAPSTGGPFTAAAVLDAGADGHLDVALTSAGQDRLLVGDGWGRFIDATLGAFPVDAADGRAVAAADVDLDGETDLVIGNRGGSDRLYMGRADGRFLDRTPDFGFDDGDTAVIVVLDLDGDGDDDVVSVSPRGDEPARARIALEVAP